jgi:hypothetical protein
MNLIRAIQRLISGWYDVPQPEFDHVQAEKFTRMTFPGSL